MTKTPAIDDPVDAIALLHDPNRRRLYQLISDATGPIGRDAAASALGISRELAAFHLDRLVDAGLLETEYRRLGDRRGPGAGRPAKLYRRSAAEIALSMPPRAYDRAASRFAEALRKSAGRSGPDALGDVAHAHGTVDGDQAKREAGRTASHRRLMAALLRLLRGAGYEPTVDDTGEVRLQNCPYRALVDQDLELTCGMNLAWALGVTNGLGDARLRAELAPAPDRCCVVFRQDSDGVGPTDRGPVDAAVPQRTVRR